jgi:adenylate cyclase 8
MAIPPLHIRRLLNEIIVDFDEILDDEKFSSVEKIKTIGTQH